VFLATFAGLTPVVPQLHTHAPSFGTPARPVCERLPVACDCAPENGQRNPRPPWHSGGLHPECPTCMLFLVTGVVAATFLLYLAGLVTFLRPMAIRVLAGDPAPLARVQDTPCVPRAPPVALWRPESLPLSTVRSGG